MDDLDRRKWGLFRQEEMGIVLLCVFHLADCEKVGAIAKRRQ